MADTVASGVQASDTDYMYTGMTQGFIARNTAQADRHAGLQSDAAADVTAGFSARAKLHDQWLGGITETMPSIISAAVGQINAIGTDDALEFVKVGAALSNSASPPIPGYQNLGTAGPGQGLVLPNKGTMTVTTA